MGFIKDLLYGKRVSPAEQERIRLKFEENVRNTAERINNETAMKRYMARNDNVPIIGGSEASRKPEWLKERPQESIIIPNQVEVTPYTPPDMLPPPSTRPMDGYFIGMREYTRKEYGL